MNNESILVVDDESAQLETLAGYLRKKKFHVFEAGNGEKGLTIVRNHLIDVVLTDMRMSEMTGIELLQEVKNMAVWMTPLLL